MVRYARLIGPQMVLHVTAMGNCRQVVSHTHNDYQLYLDLPDRHDRQFALDLLGYCLMTNHVHLLVRSRECDSLARTMKRVQSEYACCIDRGHYAESGHLWQSRFYSCP